MKLLMQFLYLDYYIKEVATQSYKPEFFDGWLGSCSKVAVIAVEKHRAGLAMLHAHFPHYGQRRMFQASVMEILVL
jgi:hypothetical protein